MFVKIKNSKYITTHPDIVFTENRKQHYTSDQRTAQ